jgi:hypothetical protein
MTQVAPEFIYSAFLSYSHADRSWGEWLQQSLESYQVPADLAGRVTSAGPVPRTLRPVFRDRWDLSAGHSLTLEIEAALRGSRFLVVLCSPHSARSHYVNEEIYRFKSLGRERQILPIIVAGRPGGEAEECFPEALRFNRTAGGALARVPDEPLAADARPEGDDRELAKLKIIAGMLGVRLDEIRKREAIEQQKRVRRARLLAGSMAALALVAVAGAGVAAWQYKLAEERRVEAVERYDQALDSTLRFVTTAATFRTLLDRQKGRDARFDLEQRQMKGASDDFQRFIQEGSSKEIWLRLVRVLLRYGQSMPAELDRYQGDLAEAKLPVQWVRHAELITTNLKRQYGDLPEYRAEMEVIRRELAEAGEEPAPDRDCTETAAIRPSRDVAMNIPMNEMNAMQRAAGPPEQRALNAPCP